VTPSPLRRTDTITRMVTVAAMEDEGVGVTRATGAGTTTAVAMTSS